MVTRSRVDRAADNFSKGGQSIEDIVAVSEYRDARTPLLMRFTHDFKNKIEREPFAIAGRVKRVTSIIRKCRRARTRISALEDLVGYRLIARDANSQKNIYNNMSLWPNLVRVRDYTATPRPDGYRALHLVFQYTLDDGSDARIEVQIRTIWQHIWANASEAFGLAVKEGGGPSNIRNYLDQLSSTTSGYDLAGEVPDDWELRLGELETPFLATFDVHQASIRSVIEYSTMESALEALLIREKADSLDAVLLLAESEEVIKLTHLSLFKRELVKLLAKLEPPLSGNQTRALLTPN